MATGPEIELSVAYATPNRQVVRAIRVPAGTTVENAIRRSGLLEEFPEISLERSRVGIFGREVAHDDVVNEGERIEIYRELIADPKEARRMRDRRRRRGERS